MLDIAFRTDSRASIRGACFSGNGYDDNMGRRADDRGKWT